MPVFSALLALLFGLAFIGFDFSSDDDPSDEPADDTEMS